MMMTDEERRLVLDLLLRIRAGLDLILDQRGADMVDLPAAPADSSAAATKARKPIGCWSASPPAWSRWSPNSAATSAGRPRSWASGRHTTRSIG